jgi:nitrite reductase/ring-hydroxylating ferredoxin subunit
MNSRRTFITNGLGLLAALPFFRGITPILPQKDYKVGTLTSIPVKGGKVFTVNKQRVLVTRPLTNEVRAFIATCTHAGARLTGASNNVITCPSHGARFDSTTGNVLKAPATRPLTQVAVRISSGDIIISI